ncbi:LINGO1 [Branchiostoma lanceolatum]|uniref:LINGO1 protein n=1 Tax=Branchiostoma lanceolatum TaxID=7740 RepID=A0A8K0ABM4_BRALA|nr:LINGO1 [Branchiostoma lanceolatum]
MAQGLLAAKVEQKKLTTIMFKPLEAWFPMILLLYPTAGQWDCPKICECSEFAQSVYCGEKFLSAMPIGIPRDVKILVLHRNNFTKLVKDQFSYLPYLTKLDLELELTVEIGVRAYATSPRHRDLLSTPAAGTFMSHRSYLPIKTSDH